MRLDVPGIGEVPIRTLQRRPVRQEVPHAQANGVTRARIGVQLGLKTEASRRTRICVTHRSIRIVQKTFVGDRLEVQCCDQIARQDLRQADAVVLAVYFALKGRIIRTAHKIVTERITQGERRHVTEHVLTD